MLKATPRLWQAAALTADLLKADLPPQWFGKLARPHIGTILITITDSCESKTDWLTAH